MTRYLTGVSDELTCRAATGELYGRLGVLLGPKTFGGPGAKDDYTSHLEYYSDWGLDNGCYSAHGEFDEFHWLSRLEWILNNIDGAWLTCRFAVAPDVFYPDRMQGDQRATIARSRPVLRAIRKLGVPAALVIQDGLHDYNLDQFPWDDFDVAFIGGSDALKLGSPYSYRGTTYRYDRNRPATLFWAEFLHRCHQYGKPIHVGRVSSEVRMAMAREIWADTADGTYLRFRGVNRGLPELDRWTQPGSFVDKILREVA